MNVESQPPLEKSRAEQSSISEPADTQRAERRRADSALGVGVCPGVSRHSDFDTGRRALDSDGRRQCIRLHQCGAR
jgi:hypothetical protein